MQRLYTMISSHTSFKIARANIKTSLDEAREYPPRLVSNDSREKLKWEYTFLLTRIHHMKNDPDTHELSQQITVIHTLRSLATQNSEDQLIHLSYLLEIHLILQHNLPIPLQPLFTALTSLPNPLHIHLK